MNESVEIGNLDKGIRFLSRLDLITIKHNSPYFFSTTDLYINTPSP